MLPPTSTSPAAALPATPLSPDRPPSGAAILFGAVQTPDNAADPAAVAAAVHNVDGITWYRGLLAILQRAALAAKGQQMPFYVAPPPVLVGIPNSRFGNPDGGISYYKSIESTLQQNVQSLAGTHASQQWTDAQVSALLTIDANDTRDWNGTADPDYFNVAGLVAKYVGVYRTAVTPV